MGLANMGLTVLFGDDTLGMKPDEHRYQDQVNEWMAWLDWSVRFVRPTWEANVTTWNMGPMGYGYSRTQLQHLLARAIGCHGARSTVSFRSEAEGET